MAAAVIPNRPLFRAQEVCELVDVQAYVLRSWEAEFPELGVAKTPAGPRMYRRADVERVLRIKDLLFVDGLTIAGARRRLSEEGLAPTAESVSDSDVAALMDDAVRQELHTVRRGLTWILGVLSGSGVTPEDRILKAPSTRAASRATSHGPRASSNSKPVKAKPAKSSKASRRPIGSKKR